LNVLLTIHRVQRIQVVTADKRRTDYGVQTIDERATFFAAKKM